MTIKRILTACAALLVVSACTPNDIGLGDAAKANYAAQIVNPEPVYAEAQKAGGDQTAAAQDRYRRGAVKRPRGVRTTSGTGG